MISESILACDLGGTRCRVAVVDRYGSVHSKRAISTPRDDPGALSRLMQSALREAGNDLAGAVIGVPGPVDYSRGEVLALPNLPNWEGKVSAHRISEELDIPVLIANDADLGALGEHRYGAGRGSQDMLYVTSSTGVGSGVIIGGRLARAKFSLAELGHTIIDRQTHGTVESLGSGTALARLSGQDAASVEGRARAGDAEAERYFASVAESFAVGVFNAVHCFSPEIVVIGGGMSRAGDRLLEPIKALVSQCGSGCPASRARVVRATGGDDAGLRGSVAYWSECQEASCL